MAGGECLSAPAGFVLLPVGVTNTTFFSFRTRSGFREIPLGFSEQATPLQDPSEGGRLTTVTLLLVRHQPFATGRDPQNVHDAPTPSF